MKTLSLARVVVLGLGLCGLPAAAQAPGGGRLPPPPPGQRPPPPPPGVMPGPVGDWKPGDPRPPPPDTSFATQSGTSQVQGTGANALPTAPVATNVQPATAMPTVASVPAAPATTPAVQTSDAQPLPREPANAFPPWPDAASTNSAQHAVPATPSVSARPRIVERVVTRNVAYWPWWATAVIVIVGLAWWRSQARAGQLADQSASLQRRQRHMAATQRHLRERAEQLQKTAVHDALTGTLTRQAFAGEFDAAVAHAAHFGQPVALLMFDLDHFKQVNDSLGHAAGDAALKLVTGIVREKLTSNDLFGRFGGDEFLIGLIGTGGPDAMRVADEIRASLMRHVQEGRAPTRELGLSLGVAVADPEAGYDVDSLFHRADTALYAAKRGGRNRAVLADRVIAETDSPDRAAAHAPRSLAR